MANIYEQMDAAQLDAEIAQLEQKVEEIRGQQLALDMARGKPSPEQTALSRPMLDLVNSQTDFTAAGGVADNYGFPDGLPAARALAADLLDVDPANVTSRALSSGSAPLPATTVTSA